MNRKPFFLKTVRQNNPTSELDLSDTLTPPSYTLPDQTEDDYEAAQVRAATELLGY